MTKLSAIAAFTLMLAFASGCGGDGVPNNISDAERRRLTDTAEQLVAEGYFRVAFPHYFPAGFDPAPFVFQKVGNHISTAFGFSDAGALVGATPDDMGLEQYLTDERGPSAAPCASEYPVEDRTVECLDIGGHIARLDITVRPEELHYDVSFDYEELFVWAMVTWKTQGRASDELRGRTREEIIRMAESITRT